MGTGECQAVLPVTVYSISFNPCHEPLTHARYLQFPDEEAEAQRVDHLVKATQQARSSLLRTLPPTAGAAAGQQMAPGSSPSEGVLGKPPDDKGVLGRQVSPSCTLRKAAALKGPKMLSGQPYQRA